MINKSDIKHLADLARLEINEKDEIKLEKNLGEILNYFNELKEVDTENVMPLTGGTELQNTTREDEPERTPDTTKGREAFPEEEDGYLKTPPVF